MDHHPTSMNNAFFKWRYVIALALSAAILLLQSCSKKDINNITGNTLEQYFESSILNRDFVVDLASDTSHDITAQYNGYVFRLLKNTLYDGPMTGVKGGVTYTGTWSSNSDYSKLTISITQPSVPAEFVFFKPPMAIHQQRSAGDAIVAMGHYRPKTTVYAKIVRLSTDVNNNLHNFFCYK